ncbi:hypothetical protein F0L17_24490 [Streptomyces sp. TRM43335]|uniref:Uncharacterized protein n=1 Tax=Streptomyces taklimakanensis TaxID=2569853 RepID=A0A6G2BIX8_9ACTN|nr:hypothetical protein [Streptomyces taklimakanensis]MTE22200.1 hypothetical protein [Streptomyces taklimakanensis]
MSTEQNGQTAQTGGQDVCQVEIELPHCTAADADAVFTALGSLFPRSPQVGNGRRGAGEEGGKGGTKFWMGTVDVRTHGEVEEAPELSEAVEADLSGSPDAVRQVQDALAGLYDVTAEPRISGDQEVEVRLRLARR